MLVANALAGEGSTVMANVVTGGDGPPLLLVHG
jgi:hypothetical protein